MEVAVRAVNWMWAAALFADAPEFTPSLKRRFLKAMLQHGDHILNNLEYADNNGNHYLSNGVGLLFLGVLFADLADARGMAQERPRDRLGRDASARCTRTASTSSRASATRDWSAEFWYSCVLLCDRNALAGPAAGARAAASACSTSCWPTPAPTARFRRSATTTTAVWRNLDDEPVGSHRRHLAVGGALFDRADLLAAAGDAVETAAWLCGPGVLSDARTAQAPRLAGVSRRRLLRHASTGRRRWSSTPARWACAASAATATPTCCRSTCGRPARRCWSTRAPLRTPPIPSLRQVLRGTAAHNAVRVDGQDTSRLGTGRWLWLIENDAQPHRHRPGSQMRGRDVVRRLARLATGACRARRPHAPHYASTSARHIWRIDDALDGVGEHLVEVFFHPGVPFEIEDDAVRLTAPRRLTSGCCRQPRRSSARSPAGSRAAMGCASRRMVLVYAVQRRVSRSRCAPTWCSSRAERPLSAARSLVEWTLDRQSMCGIAGIYRFDGQPSHPGQLAALEAWPRASTTADPTTAARPSSGRAPWPASA